MGRVQGKVALVTEAARGQRRAEAVELAEEGADLIDINLTGVFNAMHAPTPAMIEHDNGGSILVSSSAADVKSPPGQAHYCAGQHGAVGLTISAPIRDRSGTKTR
jgi:(+)-trans-carveol dehydrogenase